MFKTGFVFERTFLTLTFLFTGRYSRGRHSDFDDKDNDDIDIEHETSESPAPTKSLEPPTMPKKKSTKEERMRMRSKCNCDELRNVECVLETKELWEKFHDLETEMIITKTGR